MRPHRRQPTRLPRPWDSPDKNSGVGCHFLLQCMKVKRESEVAQSCPTLSNPMDCSLPGSSVHGIFQARVLEWGAIAFSSMGLYYTLSPPLLLVSLQSLPYIFNCKWSFLSTPEVIFMDSHSINTAILICSWEEVSSGSSYSAILTTTSHWTSQWKILTQLRIDISFFLFFNESSNKWFYSYPWLQTFTKP